MGSTLRTVVQRLTLRRVLLLVGGAKLAAFAGLGVVVLMAVLGFLGQQAQAESQTVPGPGAASIPAVALEAYRSAALRCPGLDWTILAGVGQVETRHGSLYGGQFGAEGTLDPPIFGPPLDGSGVGGNTTPWPVGAWSGWWGQTGLWQRAMGPMQFMPDTWNRLGVDRSGDGVADPQNIVDAAAAAADLLCEAGAVTDVSTALLAYNNSATYVDKVLFEAALVGEVGGTATEQALALAEHPNVEFTEWARQDLVNGIVDPRLVTMLLTTATRFRFSVGYFRTNHAACVSGTGTLPNCTVSNHWVGRAVDIGSVEGSLVAPSNNAARAMVDWWFPTEPDDPAFPGPVPQSLGSPWPEVFGFADAAHQDHLHVAFRGAG